MLDVYLVGENSCCVKIQNESSSAVLNVLSSFLVQHGWTQTAPFEFTASNLDQTSKTVRILTLEDNESGRTIGTICPVYDGKEMLEPKREGSFDRLNWFNLNHADPFELWIFASPQWLFITSKHGLEFGRGTLGTWQGVPGSFKTRWYSNKGYYSQDHFDPSDSRSRSAYRLASGDGPYYYELHWDELNDFVFKGEYEYYRTVQGIAEFIPFEGSTSPIIQNNLWLSTGSMLDQDTVHPTDYLYGPDATHRLIFPGIRTWTKGQNYVGALSRGKSVTGELENCQAFLGQQYGPITRFFDPSVSNLMDKKTVSDLSILDLGGPRGKVCGIKIAQFMSDLPFGETIKLKVDNNFFISNDGLYRDFVCIPSYVKRNAWEKTRVWTPHTSGTFVTGFGYQQYSKTVDAEINGVAGAYDCFTFGNWTYSIRQTNDEIHGTFLIPA